MQARAEGRSGRRGIIGHHEIHTLGAHLLLGPAYQVVRLQGETQNELIFVYKLPFTVADLGQTYQLLIQKQPGLNKPEYEVQFNEEGQAFKLNADKEITFEVKD